MSDEALAAEVKRLKAENIELAKLLGAFIGYHDGTVPGKHLGHIVLPKAKATIQKMIDRRDF